MLMGSLVWQGKLPQAVQSDLLSRGIDFKDPNEILELLNGYNDTCQGDSGGPIVIKGASDAQCCHIGVLSPHGSIPECKQGFVLHLHIIEMCCSEGHPMSVQCARQLTPQCYLPNSGISGRQWWSSWRQKLDVGSSTANDVQVGIVSYGIGCGSGVAGVYTSIQVKVLASSLLVLFNSLLPKLRSSILA